MSNLLLEPEATQQTVAATPDWERPILTYEDAFVEARLPIMPAKTKRMLKLKTEVAVSAQEQPQSFVGRHPGLVLAMNTAKGFTMYVLCVIAFLSLGCLGVLTIWPDYPAMGFLFPAVAVVVIAALVGICISDTRKARDSQWLVNRFNLSTGTYEAITHGQKGFYAYLSPAFHLEAALRLDEKLRRVPGLEYEHVVETFCWDPIAGIRIRRINGVVMNRIVSYLAWENYQVTWQG